MFDHPIMVRTAVDLSNKSDMVPDVVHRNVLSPRDSDRETLTGVVGSRASTALPLTTQIAILVVEELVANPRRQGNRVKEQTPNLIP
jgi:hypothetical protein